MGKLEKLQTEAAKRFLQTALIVDDRASVTPPAPSEPEIIEKKEVEEPPGPNMGEAALAAGESSQAPVSSDQQKQQDEEREKKASEVSVKDLADRFADLVGVTCGILKPTKEEDNAEVTERIVLAARGVDIVVIDWKLDDGLTAGEAVRRIVAEAPKARRLLAIYTTQRKLGEISDELLKIIPIAAEVAGEDLALDAEGTRIVIFHKGGPTLDEEFEQYLCPEEELPERLVDVFVSQTAGLVPAVALNALAATRENTHRLLGRLRQDLDLGYMGHLLRLADQDEGKQHLLDAISGEFRAVVEDDLATSEVATDGFTAWLADHESQLKVPIEGLKTLGTALADSEKIKAWNSEHGKKNSRAGKITTLLVEKTEEESAVRSDASFAQLMAMRRPYSGQDPPLHLGTIVREHQMPDNYWLCIQPLCDSVRLPKEEPTGFLMLPLDSVKAGDKASFAVTLPGDADEQVLLHLWDRSSDLELMRMVPNRNGGVVFEGEEESDAKTFTTEEGIVLTWIAQLKPVHASRVAHAYGTHLSRVGLDESEWLRVLAGKGNPPTRRPRVALVDRIAP